jgi:hypothetical protein
VRKLDLNDATAEQFMVALGLDLAWGEWLVATRTRLGRFSTVDQLLTEGQVPPHVFLPARDKFAERTRPPPRGPLPWAPGLLMPVLRTSRTPIPRSSWRHYRSPLQLSTSAPTRDRSVKSVEHDAQKESALRTVCPGARGASGVGDAAEE